jgi:nucleotidyltransferase substrate binding protein (TIGR01987 family)
METGRERVEAFGQAFDTLREACGMTESDIVRDGSIQRFEYTYDLFWKCLRDFLRDTHGLICNSPKLCFREAFSLGLFDDEDTVLLIEMADDRNVTAHTYSKIKTLEIFGKIKKKYLPLIEKAAKVFTG